jgi:hypothetical protein
MAGYFYFPIGSQHQNSVLVCTDGQEIARCPNCPIVFRVDDTDEFLGQKVIKRFSFNMFSAWRDPDTGTFVQNHWLVPMDEFVKSGIEGAIDNSPGGNTMADKVPASATVWVVGSSSGKGRISMSAEPKQHESEREAMAEATRLAAAVPAGSTTKAYIVFQMVGVAEVRQNTKKGF